MPLPVIKMVKLRNLICFYLVLCSSRCGFSLFSHSPPSGPFSEASIHTADSGVPAAAVPRTYAPCIFPIEFGTNKPSFMSATNDKWPQKRGNVSPFECNASLGEKLQCSHREEDHRLSAGVKKMSLIWRAMGVLQSRTSSSRRWWWGWEWRRRRRRFRPFGFIEVKSFARGQGSN